jgi:hypothetical protein
MKSNESLANAAGRRFRTTPWSVVLFSAQTQVPGSQTAFKNYLSDEFDGGRSIKRGGQIEFVILDFDHGEENGTGKIGVIL